MSNGKYTVYGGYAIQIGVQQVEPEVPDAPAAESERKSARAFIRYGKADANGEPLPPVQIIWLTDGYADVHAAAAAAQKLIKTKIDTWNAKPNP